MKLSKYFFKAMSCMAIALVVMNVNATCGGPLHQPKIPAAALKFKK